MGLPYAELSAEQRFFVDKVFEKNNVLVDACIGSGKAITNSTLIPTPSGLRKVGDIKKGDYLYDRNGIPTQVLAVYSQGLKDVYEVTLEDDRKALCCENHNWSVFDTHEHKIKSWTEAPVKTVKEILEAGVKSFEIPRFRIPVHNSVYMREADYKTDPYVMGAVIGCGDLSKKILTLICEDNGVPEKISKILNAAYKKSKDGWIFIRADKSRVRTNDIINTTTVFDNPCIPAEYKTGSTSQRLQLIQGLMDACGDVNPNDRFYNISFKAESNLLISDMTDVLRSVGYIVRQADNKIYIFANAHNTRKLFTTKQKLKDVWDISYSNMRKDYDTVAITDIKILGYQEEMTCFTVDNSEGLFLMNDYIVTHNTTAIQSLCDTLPSYLSILYLTYNRLLKVDARQKIRNSNVLVTNYHGFVYPYLQQAGIRCGISDSITNFNRAKLSIAKFDVMIIDEYQDIELDFAEMLEYIKSTNPNMQIVFVGDMAQKIYDKTTLKVEKWAEKFMGKRIELEFTQCFRLCDEHATMLGRIWNKTIKGVNPKCKVRKMNPKDVADYIAGQYPGDVICLGAKTGKMSKTLNYLEKYHSYKFNKNTVYATIQDRDANINPSPSTAIFTTFDSSKGMEKPICIVFDWDEKYWLARNSQPNANYDILKNIFCVAASRGKDEIIFVTSDTPQLTEHALSMRIKSKSTKEAHVSNMFDFKFTEEIDKCMEFLNIIPVKHANSCEPINIPDADGLIDLTPCIGIYQEASYFNNYDMNTALEDAFKKRGFTPTDLSDAGTDIQILNLIALETHQNRYKYQVKLPFVNQAQCEEIHSRLSENLNRDDEIQVSCHLNIEGIVINGRCDVIHDNTVWELKFVKEIKREHYLQLAMYLVALSKRNKTINETGRLWNTRDNTIFDVSIKTGKEQEFLKQVAKTIRKDTYTSTTRLSSAQQTAVNRYKKRW